MGNLAKDLEAVRILFEQDRQIKHWGYLVTVTDSKTPILPEDDFKFVETTFESLENPDARIGIVYLEKSHSGMSDLWGSVIRDCFDDMAGVIVFSQQNVLNHGAIDTDDAYGFIRSRVSIESRAEFFFSRIPKEFFDAALPIVFDESNGVLDRFSPTSDHIAAEHLSFIYPTKCPDAYYAFSCGRDIHSYDKTHAPFLWDSPCPVVNIFNEDEAKGILECCRLVKLIDCAKGVHHDFYNVTGLSLQNPSDMNTTDVNKALDAMQDALPGCFDEEIIEMLHSYPQDIKNKRDTLRAPSYITLIRKEDFPEYAVFEEKMNLFENGAELCWIAVARYPKYYREDTGSDILGWNGFKEVCENTGLMHQLKALNSGVPIEDILA